MITVKLPSSGKEIQLRDVTVEVALELARFGKFEEEKAVTFFLNELQSDDAKAWTIEDRQLITLLLYFEAGGNPEQKFQYNCSHCGEKHSFPVELPRLVSTCQSLKIPLPSFEFLDQSWSLRPLNGRHAEILEEHELERGRYEKNSSEYRQATTQLKLLQLQMMTGDEEKKRTEKMTWKEFLVFSDLVKVGIPALKHGMEWKAEHSCPKEGDVSQIAIPFSANDYLPQL